MKCAQENTSFLTRNTVHHTASHFICSFVSERQTKNTEILIATRIENAYYTARENPCLTGTRTCQYQKRAFVPFCGFSLNKTQFFPGGDEFWGTHVDAFAMTSS